VIVMLLQPDVAVLIRFHGHGNDEVTMVIAARNTPEVADTAGQHGRWLELVPQTPPE
jgi:hypothetical protein